MLGCRLSVCVCARLLMQQRQQQQRRVCLSTHHDSREAHTPLASRLRSSSPASFICAAIASRLPSPPLLLLLLLLLRLRRRLPSLTPQPLSLSVSQPSLRQESQAVGHSRDQRWNDIRDLILSHSLQEPSSCLLVPLFDCRRSREEQRRRAKAKACVSDRSERGA